MKSNKSRWHLDVLPRKQRRVWDLFQERQISAGIYLAGGTALAIQLGHRQSVDYDFFSRNKNLAESVLPWLEKFPAFTLRELDQNTIHAEIHGVKVSFIGSYKYPQLEPSLRIGNVPLASQLDIGLMKLLSLTHRATMRDYVDLAALIKNGISLPALLNGIPRKYGSKLNSLMLIRALVSFEDLERETPRILDPSLKHPRSWQKILRDEVRRIC